MDTQTHTHTQPAAASVGKSAYVIELNHCTGNIIVCVTEMNTEHHTNIKLNGHDKPCPYLSLAMNEPYGKHDAIFFSWVCVCASSVPLARIDCNRYRHFLLCLLLAGIHSFCAVGRPPSLVQMPFLLVLVVHINSQHISHIVIFRFHC